MILGGLFCTRKQHIELARETEKEWYYIARETDREGRGSLLSKE
jgi:hypothetical protein